MASQDAVIFTMLASHFGGKGNLPEKMHAQPGSHISIFL
jgi:hypothetical protein